MCLFVCLSASVVADTCISMDEWVQNPTAKTALDDIIPCVDNATAQETLRQTKETTYQLVNVVDYVVSNVSNRNFPPQARDLYYNQSGPLMPVLCNPFNSDFTDRKCAAGEVDLSNATQVIYVNMKSVNRRAERHFIYWICWRLSHQLSISLADAI